MPSLNQPPRLLDIAGIPLAIETDGESGAILARWAPTWSGAERPGSFRIRIEARAPSRPGAVEIVDGDACEVVPVAEQMEGRIDLRRETASYVVAPFAVHVLSAVRLTFAVVALRRGVLWMHAVGFRREESAIVLVGRSGAGKTTLGRLVDRRALLGDDTVALCPGGQDGPTAYATPFQSAGAEPPGPGRGRLNGLYLLEQGPRTAIRSVSRTAALARLWSCVFSPERSSCAQAQALSLLDTVVGQTPPAVFTCALEPGVLDIIP